MLPDLLASERKSTVSVTATCVSPITVMLAAAATTIFIITIIFIFSCISPTETSVYSTKQNPDIILR
jgi:ABC-type multidrug transport system permease subunit